MKNIHILPTDKTSRLVRNGKELLLVGIPKNYTFFGITVSVNIYITSDEEPKHLDYYFDFEHQKVKECETGYYNKGSKKIILTTDEDLIEDGVQAIDDEFLEWFVKNPSCEEVKVVKTAPIRPFGSLYKIIIPKEEPKKNFYCGDEVDYDDKCLEQCDGCVDATGVDYGYIEEVAIINYKKLYEGEPLTQDVPIDAFKQGAKWQQERSYSEEDMKSAFKVGFSIGYGSDVHAIDEKNRTCDEWFNKFKKK